MIDGETWIGLDVDVKGEIYEGLLERNAQEVKSCAGRPGSLHAREENLRFRSFAYDDLVARDKANLDIFWLKDDSLEDAYSLPAPAVLAAEIIENLEAALEQFREAAAALGSDGRDGL